MHPSILCLLVLLSCKLSHMSVCLSICLSVDGSVGRSARLSSVADLGIWVKKLAEARKAGRANNPGPPLAQGLNLQLVFMSVFLSVDQSVCVSVLPVCPSILSSVWLSVRSFFHSKKKKKHWQLVVRSLFCSASR